MKKGWSIWDILAWVALASIVIWVTLKILEVINTPLWLEYAPVYSAIYIAGWQISKLSTVAEEVKSLKLFRDETIKQIHLVKENCVRNHK